MSEDEPLPRGWTRVRIRDKYGFTNKPEGRQISSFEKVAFIPMDLVPIGRLTFSDFVPKRPDEISSGTYFEEGDLLVSKITPCFENGKQGIARDIPNGFGVATTEVIPVKAVEGESEVEFLSYCLLDHQVRHSLAEKMEGATGRQRLSKTVLQDWEILYPPKKERAAIVSVLSKLQSAIEVQDKTIRTLKDLKAATMAKLFREGLRGEKLKDTEIGEIPQSWEIVRLGDHCKIRSGGTPSRAHPEYWNGEIPWVKTGEIDYRVISTTEEKITEAALENSSAKIFPAGTVLMAMYGEGVTRGRVGVLGIDATTNQACAAFFPDGTFVKEYLYAWFVLSYEHIRSTAHGANQKNLSNDLISNLQIPRPPDGKEQREIGELVGAFDSRIAAAQTRAETLSSLFGSTLHLLMTGQVRVTPEMMASQDLADGKAHEQKHTGTVSEQLLREIVRRIVETVAPEKIILFGSAARGEMGPDSDVDLLVVASSKDRRETARAIRRRLFGIGIPKDIVVATPEDIEKCREIPGYVIRYALQEGKVIYAA